MKRSPAFNTQTQGLFGPMILGTPISQLIQQYQAGIAQIKSNILTGRPLLVDSELYLYGDLQRASNLLKRYGYNVPFIEACVRNPYRHQWCMPRIVGHQAALALNALSLPGSYSSFDDLYEAVANTVKGIKGIGRSAIYDAALRIGHTIGLEPDEYVYFHGGLKICVEKIMNRKIPNNRYKIPRIDFEKAYSGFIGMPSMEIEDFSCIYKDVI